MQFFSITFYVDKQKAIHLLSLKNVIVDRAGMENSGKLSNKFLPNFDGIFSEWPIKNCLKN
jgi:hypothetical protein